MATKTFPENRNRWKVTLEVHNNNNDVSLYEASRRDGSTDRSWLIVDKGEQLDWLIAQLQEIQKEA